MLIDGFQALCWAGMGDRERSLTLARRGVEQARANALDTARIIQGILAARVLRMVGGLQHQDELEAQIAETLELIQRTDAKGWLPLLLLERAGLARLRGDADGMARDLAEARRLFARDGRDRLGRLCEVDRGMSCARSSDPRGSLALSKARGKRVNRLDAR